MPTYDYPKSQIHPKQKATLKMLLYKCNAQKVVEIGSWLGESTEVIASFIRPFPVHVVDWFKGNKGTELEGIAEKEDIFPLFKKNMEELGLYDQIRPLLMDSVSASRFFKDNYFDFVFIDASHDYESVKADIEAWLPKVRTGGIICGHDCEARDWDEKYIHQDVHDHKHHGVIKAVNEAFGDSFNIDERIWWICKK